MEGYIEPKRVIYKGQEYKSTLEAKWRFFIDQSRSITLYEDEGIEYGENRMYWPDFKVLQGNAVVWIEVKGIGTQNDVEKLRAVQNTGAYIYVLGDIPQHSRIEGIIADLQEKHEKAYPVSKFSLEYVTGEERLTIPCIAKDGYFMMAPVNDDGTLSDAVDIPATEAAYKAMAFKQFEPVQGESEPGNEPPVESVEDAKERKHKRGRAVEKVAINVDRLRERKKERHETGESISYKMGLQHDWFSRALREGEMDVTKVDAVAEILEMNRDDIVTQEQLGMTIEATGTFEQLDAGQRWDIVFPHPKTWENDKTVKEKIGAGHDNWLKTRSIMEGISVYEALNKCLEECEQRYPEITERANQLGAEGTKWLLNSFGASPIRICTDESRALGYQDLSARTYNCLNKAGYKNVDDVRKASDETLLKIEHFGRGCLDELKQKGYRS